MTRRELTPADYLAMLQRHWVLIVLLALIGPPLGYGLTKVLPAKYKSKAVLLVQAPTVSSKIVDPVDEVGVSERLMTLEQQLLSTTRLEQIVRKTGLFPADIGRVPMGVLAARLQKNIKVEPLDSVIQTQSNNSPGFSIGVTLYSPQAAQKACSAITALFLDESSWLQNQRSTQTNDFLSQQLADAKAALDAQDAKLATFQSRHLDSLPDDAQTNLNLLSAATSQLEATTQALERAQQDKSFAETMLNQQLAAWRESQSGHNPQTLEQQLAALQARLESLQAQYTDAYPDVISTKADIAALKKKIAASKSAEKSADTQHAQKEAIEPERITQLRLQVKAAAQTIAQKKKAQAQIKEQIEAYQSRLQASPLINQQYKELTRGYKTDLDSYNDLLRKKQASEMSGDLARQKQGEQITLLDAPNLPGAPSFPNPLLFSLGGLAAGLGSGVGLAFLKEMQDTSMHSERDVEYALRLPVLAMIPAVDPISRKKSAQPKSQRSADSSLSTAFKV